MAKLTITLAAALLVALFAVASATTYTTTITTTIIDDEMDGSECSQQIQPQQQLQHCMMYLSPRGPMRYAMNAQEQHLKECCREMRSIDKSCRCMAIKEMVKQQQQGQWQTEQMQQMVQDAQSLPSKCNIEMPQQCQIRAVYF